MSQEEAKFRHISVLQNEVQKWLKIKKGGIYVDCTLGLGGHSEKILEEAGKKGFLIGFDQDERNLELAKKRLKSYEKQIKYVGTNFVHLQEVLKDSGVEGVDGVLYDLGIASTHVDEAERGFSFKKEGPLDMRYSETQTRTAYDLISQLPAVKLAKIFREYGEERWAMKIANAIVARRKEKKIKTTTELADLIASLSRGHQRIHPATRVFQALRIAVNNELEVLQSSLEQAVDSLKKGGRVVVISYHSLEDRIVKRFFKLKQKGCICPTEYFECICTEKPSLKILTKKPVTPTEEEIVENPRSRSAKLRAAERI